MSELFLSRDGTTYISESPFIEAATQTIIFSHTWTLSDI